MPNFDTRKPQEPNEPNRFRIQLVANKLRTLVIAAKTRTHLIANKLRGLLMPSKLRILLLSSGVLLFVTVAVTVALLIYAPRWLGNQKQEVMDKAADTNSAGSCAGRGGTDRQQESSGEASNGEIVVQQPTDPTAVYVIDEDDTNETRTTHAVDYVSGAVLSPDAGKIAFVRQGDVTTVLDVYVMNADGTNETRIPMNVENDDYPYIARTVRRNLVWSPDSKHIAFTSYTLADAYADSTASPGPAEEINGIYVASVDGTGLCMISEFPSTNGFSGTTAKAPNTQLTWSPDGEKIAFHDGQDIEVIKADGSRGWVPINTIYSAEPPHSWSPDGKRIALTKQADLHVTNAAGGKQRLLTDYTAAPEAFPAWSPDGKRIAFLSGAALPSASASSSASADTEGESADLYVVNADGTGRRRLADATAQALPVWSPDGEKIAFFCPAPPGSEGTDLCVINADGTEWARHDLASGDYHEIEFVSWGELETMCHGAHEPGAF
jgi:Tol biopolymer transport system component